MRPTGSFVVPVETTSSSTGVRGSDRAGYGHLRLVVSRTASSITDRRGTVGGACSSPRLPCPSPWLLRERQRTEERLRAIVETAPDPVIGVDPDGRIMLVNVQTEQQFGYTRAQLVGQPVEILLPEAHQPARLQPDRRPCRVGAGLRLSARRRDGTEFPADVCLASVRTGNDTIAVVIIRVVTDHVRAYETPSRSGPHRPTTAAV